MHITSVKVRNFRLLQETELKLSKLKRQELALLIGKNNTGKTSFVVLMDKFLRGDSKFNFNDFSICLRKQIKGVKTDPGEHRCSIQMHLEIAYDQNDNLAVLSDFILDLTPKERVVKILFECTIDTVLLSGDLKEIDDKYAGKYIEKNLSNYLYNKIYVYADEADLTDKPREKLVEKTSTDIHRLINYQVIHAKRNVSSSEMDGNRSNVLSDMASSYFNKGNLFSKSAFGKINDKILEVDDDLNKTYAEHFQEYFKSAKDFVDGGNLNVISNLESKQILNNYARVVYGVDADNYLPETLNGLGHLNILFLLLNIEVKRKYFEQEKRDINLLFIEEPEAHTHPQMQYIFAKRIKKILTGVNNLQTFITSHSSHIVSQCDFEDLRYFKVDSGNILIKNFHETLAEKYREEKEHFKFLKQYLTLYASELFFAEKIVFIEGISEKLLLPLFIKQFDDEHKDQEGYLPLTSQNISYVEAGANARVFHHFIDFLGIKTLVITDFDGCNMPDNQSQWVACESKVAKYTTNVTLKHYYNAPELPPKRAREADPAASEPFDEWFTGLKKGTVIPNTSFVNIAYQVPDEGYHARSFEDAFFCYNLKNIVSNVTELNGLQNIEEITSARTDYYSLLKKSLKDNGKSDFASSLLYLALTKDVKWTIPTYITNGLNWIAK